MSTIRKKKIMPWAINPFGLFSTRSHLQDPCPQQHNTLDNVHDNPATTTSDMGGTEEDPLPTTGHSSMPKKIERTYNGTLYRSTTARPLAYDPLIYRDYLHDRALKGSAAIHEEPWIFKARRIFGLVKRYLLVKVRDLHRLANLVYFPTIDILLGGLIWLWREQSNPDLGHACAEYIFSLIFWTIANAAEYETCFNFLEEFQSHNLLNIFSTSLEHNEWLVASAFLCCIESFTSALICSVIAYAALGINILSMGWLLPIFALVLAASGWIMGILTSGIFLIFGQRATFLIWAIPYLILPLSAPFYPIAALPVWAQGISYCLPTTYIFEGIRLLIYGNPVPTSYLAMSFILTCIYLILAVLFFNRMFKQSKEKGLAKLEQE
jgi:ABC-2 type transport system permease protein